MSILSKITFDNLGGVAPRFSVADAKVLRVFGIAKPIHYFFSKKVLNRGVLGRKRRESLKKNKELLRNGREGVVGVIGRSGGIDILYYI